jgi:hypothetical protein
MKKNIALVAVFAVALVSTWPIYSKIAQGRRDAAYRTAIAPFQRDLRVGMAEAEVKKYLDSRQVAYYPVRSRDSDRWAYEIKIGEEPSSVICERDVYVALDFGSSDTLTDVHIKKIRTCEWLP